MAVNINRPFMNNTGLNENKLFFKPFAYGGAIEIQKKVGYRS